MIKEDFRLRTHQAEQYQNSGILLMEGFLELEFVSRVSPIVHNRSFGVDALNDSAQEIERGSEIFELLSSRHFKTLIYHITQQRLLFVGARIASVDNGASAGWDCYSDMYSNQAPLGRGCTLWIPLSLGGAGDELTASLISKRYGYCEPIYRHLQVSGKEEKSAPHNKCRNSKNEVSTFENLWRQTLGTPEMGSLLNLHCSRLSLAIGSALLCDKMAVLDFDYLSDKQNSQCLLLALVFYSDDSILTYRGAEPIRSGSLTISKLARIDRNHDREGSLIRELPVFKHEPYRKIGVGMLNINQIKAKFDARICFD